MKILYLIPFWWGHQLNRKGLFMKIFGFGLLYRQLNVVIFLSKFQKILNSKHREYYFMIYIIMH